MSSALVRQALEFVDPDVCGGKRKKRGGKKKPVGQELSKIEKSKKNKQPKESEGEKLVTRERVIERLLKLSRPVADRDTAKKIAQRVTKGKPLVDKIKVKKEPQKSILFPDD